MQVTTFTPYSLRVVLHHVTAGNRVAGYTTNPQRPLPGLFIYSRNIPRGKAAGY